MARVKQVRQVHGLTQEEFAERAGLDYKYYQHVEAGRRPNLGMETLLKIAKGCRLELWELLNFESDLPALAEEKASAGFKATNRAGTKKTGKKRAEG